MVKRDDIGKLQGKRTEVGNEPHTRYVGELERPYAEHQAALKRIVEKGVATGVRILASHDSCPVCRAYEGAYNFDDVPELPHIGCSHPLGCRCHYAPILDRRGP